MILCPIAKTQLQEEPELETVESDQQMKGNRESFDNYVKNGSSGPKDSRVPVPTKSIFGELHGEKSNLSVLWAEVEIDRRARK